MTRNSFLFFLSLCLIPSNSFAGGCSYPLLNKVGDQVEITITLTSTVPDADAQGPIFNVSSTGGFSQSLATYQVPTIFIFTATQKNEVINAASVSASTTELCNISATTNTVPWFTPLDKQSMSVYSKVLGITAVAAGAFAGACAVATLGLCTTIGAPVAFVGAMAGALGLYAGKEANDPPDPDFTQIAQPVIPNSKIVINPNAPPTVASAFQNLGQVLQQTEALEQALSTTLNRATSASLAQNQQAINAQSAQATQLKQRLGALFALQIRFLKETKSALIQTNSDASVSAAEIKQFQQSLLTKGFSSTQLSGFTQLGITEKPDIDYLVAYEYSQDANIASGNIGSVLANSDVINALTDASRQFAGACATLYITNASLGAKSGDPGYMLGADLDHNGYINQNDLTLAAALTPNSGQCFLNEVDAIRGLSSRRG